MKKNKNLIKISFSMAVVFSTFSSPVKQYKNANFHCNSNFSKKLALHIDNADVRNPRIKDSKEFFATLDQVDFFHKKQAVLKLREFIKSDNFLKISGKELFPSLGCKVFSLFKAYKALINEAKRTKNKQLRAKYLEYLRNYVSPEFNLSMTNVELILRAIILDQASDADVWLLSKKDKDTLKKFREQLRLDSRKIQKAYKEARVIDQFSHDLLRIESSRVAQREQEFAQLIN